MKIITDAQRKVLIANNNATMAGDETPRPPVVKLFTPWTNATWLFTELDPETNVAFGLCDLGHGEPELGYVSIDEISAIRGPAGLTIERDRYFDAKGKTINMFAAEARKARRITA